MAAISTIIAGAALATTAVGTISSISNAREARKTQKQVSSEQKAVNASEAARERRQQIREERIRRARILQSSENTGVTGSSGEFGAIGALSTGLASNIAANIGRLESASRISDLNQRAADSLNASQTASQVAQLSGSIFSASRGFSSLPGSSIFKPTDPLGEWTRTGTSGD